MISVCTIVAGRQTHLANQARGLAASRRLPEEWVIVGMNEDAAGPAFVRSGCEVPVVTGRVDGRGRMPLAEARSRAAELASGSRLVFLDVDCIPHPDMIDAFARALDDEDRLWMGDVRYLPQGAAADDWTAASLDAAAVPHPLLPDLGGRPLRSDRYELFWSLCFACTADTWRRIGGFDTGYRGYGGEDTDFAFSARAAGVGFGHWPARAYHQHHAVCRPPLNHLASIVENARRFRGKWGVWPMEAWLRQFAEAGFVEFDGPADVLSVRRLPSRAEVAACRVRTPAGF